MADLEYRGGQYSVIADLGAGGKTWLLRSEDGRLMVAKQVEEPAAQIYRSLRKHPHPNIVKVEDVLGTEGGALVLQEYYPSTNLADRLAAEGKLPPAEAKRITAALCRAMQHYSQYRIVHRDIKPENVLLGRDGGIKVTDFDISRVRTGENARDTTIMGTAGYAAPEQFGFRETDIRADIFALGVLMNEMLTGQMPQQGRYAGEPALAALIGRCTAIAPDERPEIREILDVVDPKAVPRLSFRRVLRRIPGYRTNNKIHMTLATVWYGYVAFLYGINILFGVRNPWKMLPGFLIMSLGLGATVGNYHVVRDRLGWKKGWKKVLLLLLFGIVIFIELYIGSTML